MSSRTLTVSAGSVLLFDSLVKRCANEINRLLAKLDIAEKSAEDIIRLALRQTVT